MKIEVYEYDYNNLKEDNREAFAKIMFGDTPTQKEINELYFKIAEINIANDEDVPARDHSELCEAMFMFFNKNDRPNGKYFRSMSVGDIVSIDDNKYICASFGFEKIDIDLSLVPIHENSQKFSDIF